MHIARRVEWARVHLVHLDLGRKWIETTNQHPRRSKFAIYRATFCWFYGHLRDKTEHAPNRERLPDQGSGAPDYYSADGGESPLAKAISGE